MFSLKPNTNGSVESIASPFRFKPQWPFGASTEALLNGADLLTYTLPEATQRYHFMTTQRGAAKH